MLQILECLVKTASHISRIDNGIETVAVTIFGSEYDMPAGRNLAGEMIAAGITPFRHTPVSGAPRDAYCMMGACFDCLVEVEGENRQACMMRVAEGLVVNRPSIQDPTDG